jgi:hypothetical protein
VVKTNFDLIDFPARHKSVSSLDFLSLSDIGWVGGTPLPRRRLKASMWLEEDELWVLCWRRCVGGYRWASRSDYGSTQNFGLSLLGVTGVTFSR